jgi:predicted TIM-barrel fold metal-dependent hydrolase
MSTTRPPKQRAPAGTCDCHFHIFGPYDRFPLSAGRTYNPPPALVPEYLAMAESLGIERMIVVQASVSGIDNAVTLDAVRQFGQHRARAVAVIDDSFSDTALRAMDADGVRGVRFNLSSGNGTPVEQLAPIARRLAPLGWHIQVYTEGETLAEMAPVLAGLPVPVVIDHCGGVMAGLGMEHPQFRSLLELLDSGNAWIKVCSYRVSSTGQPWADPAPNVTTFVSRYPDRCIWGTDWPHPQMNPRPEAGLLLDQFLEWVPDTVARQRVLVDNPARLYGF